MNLKQSTQGEDINTSGKNNLEQIEFSSDMKSQKTSPVQNWQLAIATIVLLSFGFLLGQKSQPQRLAVPTVATQQQANILPVKTVAIEAVDSYSTSQTYTGEVTASRTSEVGFERGGKLIKVLVEEGDLIGLNIPLAKLDTTNLEAQRQGLNAQKAQAQAVLAELQNGARREQISAAQARVRDLQQQLELEKIRSSRREYLYNQGAIAREELDEIAFNQKALTERLTNAKSNLDELNNGTRIEQISAQQAAVDRLTAEIKDLDITIDKSIIRSPFNGIVAARNLDEGTVIQAGQSVLRLVENTQPEVKVGVPIPVANQIQPGSQQQLTIDGQEYDANVSAILPEVNAATRTRTVVLKLSASAATQVSPQQMARLKITQNRSIDGYWLPINALVKSDRGLWSCYAMVESSGKNKTERRYVELLETQGDRVLVRGTLQEGDEIIIDGTHRLVPGQLVKPL
ncbi:MAG: efflux RND transporter periplasmic adaptor subunit [Cyanobacteria bacterium P01_G01_bin.39]